MRQFANLTLRELGENLSSPMTYVMMAVFAGISGFLFYNLVSYFALQCSQAIQVQADYGVKLPPMNANQWVISPFFVNLATITLFLIPILTMKSFAGERAYGTAELLMTLPFRTSQIVLAKFTATFVVYVFFLVITLVFMIILNFHTQNGIDWGPVWAGYLGLALMGAGLIPVGQFTSTLTRNQIVAAFVSFALFLTLWMISWSAIFYYGTTAQIIGKIGISPHILNFTRGIIDIADIVYFLSLGIFGAFLTAVSVESWRLTGA